MKIAIVNMFYYPTIGGVEQVMKEIGERFVKQGHEVHVFCCDSDKNKRIEKKEETINGVIVHRISYWFQLTRFTFIWPGLKKELMKYNFDIIHSHVSGHAYVYTSGKVAKKKGWKHIHTTHSPWTDSFRPWYVKPILFLNDKIFNKKSFAMCDKVVSITPWEFDTLKKYGVNDEQLRLIPNGMDDIHFERVIPNKFKEKLGVEDKKLVLFFGRFNITKGADKLVLAAKDILKERDDIFFLFRGPDEGTRDKIEMMTECDVNIKVMYETRDKKEIAEMYQAADVYALPSYREGLPLTLFEAMAAGLPIVASAVNGVPFEVKEGVNGHLLQYGDVQGLKRSILDILDNPEVANKMKRNNLEKSKNYNWDIITKRYMEVYKEALKEK